MPNGVDRKLGLVFVTSPSALSVKSGTTGDLIYDYMETRPGSHHWDIKSKNLDLSLCQKFWSTRTGRTGQKSLILIQWYIISSELLIVLSVRVQFWSFDLQSSILCFLCDLDVS